MKPKISLRPDGRVVELVREQELLRNLNVRDPVSSLTGKIRPTAKKVTVLPPRLFGLNKILTKHTSEDRVILNSKASQVQTTMHLASILVPVDFSTESKTALRYAASFAQQFGASVTLVHVVEPIVCLADFGYGPVTRCSPNKDLLKKAKTRLNLFTKRLAVSQPKTSAILRTGVAETEIVATARDLETDLIVMGTRGDSAAGQPTPGSTAERVVRHAPCPVFIVRKKEHEFVWSRKSR